MISSIARTYPSIAITDISFSRQLANALRSRQDTALRDLLTTASHSTDLSLVQQVGEHQAHASKPQKEIIHAWFATLSYHQQCRFIAGERGGQDAPHRVATHLARDVAPFLDDAAFMVLPQLSRWIRQAFLRSADNQGRKLAIDASHLALLPQDLRQEAFDRWHQEARALPPQGQAQALKGLAECLGALNDHRMAAALFDGLLASIGQLDQPELRLIPLQAMASTSARVPVGHRCLTHLIQACGEVDVERLNHRQLKAWIQMFRSLPLLIGFHGYAPQEKLLGHALQAALRFDGHRRYPLLIALLEHTTECTVGGVRVELMKELLLPALEQGELPEEAQTPLIGNASYLQRTRDEAFLERVGRHLQHLAPELRSSLAPMWIRTVSSYIEHTELNQRVVSDIARQALALAKDMAR